MQSIVQYRFDPATGAIEIIKRFTSPYGGSQKNIKKKKAPKQMVSEKVDEEYM